MSEGRIGVFICAWGSGKEPRLDMEGLLAFAKGMEGVEIAQLVDRVCSRSGQKEMVSAIRGSGIDRFVVAACSGLTKAKLYRSIASDSGLHPLAYEVANIREQAAYVHDLPGSQLKAETLVRMAVDKMRLWVAPPFETEMPVSTNVVVVGGGQMALSVARELASMGHPVDLVLSHGTLRALPSYVFRTASEREKAIGHSMEAGQAIRMHFDARVLEVQGGPGEFTLVLDISGDILALRCGAIVLAPEPGVELKDQKGAPAPDPEELASRGLKRIAIMPSGSSSGVGCSCITPRGTLYALASLARVPDAEISLFGREIRALGEIEDLQKLAQAKGVRFNRIESEPKVDGSDPSTIRWKDPLAGEMACTADLVLVDSVLTPEAQAMSRAFDLPVDERGELLRIESRLRPGETVRRGIFATRYRLGNMIFDDIAIESAAVAASASELLSFGTMEVGGVVAEVDQEKCSACLSCVRLCPYSAPAIGSEGKAEIRIELCQGCGSCVGLCPGRAIDLYCFSGSQLAAQSKAALRRGIR